MATNQRQTQVQSFNPTIQDTTYRPPKVSGMADLWNQYTAGVDRAKNVKINQQKADIQNKMLQREIDAGRSNYDVAKGIISATPEAIKYVDDAKAMNATFNTMNGDNANAEGYTPNKQDYMSEYFNKKYGNDTKSMSPQALNAIVASQKSPTTKYGVKNYRDPITGDNMSVDQRNGQDYGNPYLSPVKETTGKNSYKLSKPFMNEGQEVVEKIVDGKPTGEFLPAPLGKDKYGKSVFTEDQVYSNVIQKYAKLLDITPEEVMSNPDFTEQAQTLANGSDGKMPSDIANPAPMKRGGNRDTSEIGGRAIKNVYSNGSYERHYSDTSKEPYIMSDKVEKFRADGQEAMADALESSDENAFFDKYSGSQMYDMLYKLSGGNPAVTDKMFMDLSKSKTRAGGIGSFLAHYTPSVVEWNENSADKKKQVLATLFQQGRMKVNDGVGQGGLDSAGTYPFVITDQNGQEIENPTKYLNGISKDYDNWFKEMATGSGVTTKADKATPVDTALQLNGPAKERFVQYSKGIADGIKSGKLDKTQASAWYALARKQAQTGNTKLLGEYEGYVGQLQNDQTQDIGQRNSNLKDLYDSMRRR